MGNKKPFSLEEAKNCKFQSIPIFKISHAECSRGNLQNLLQKFMSESSPMIAFRCDKPPVLPKMRQESFDKKLLKITTKQIEGFSNDSISSIFQHGEPSEQLAIEYAHESMLEGQITRDEFLENLYSGPFLQKYCEANEEPEVFLDFSKSTFQFDLVAENNLRNVNIPGVTKPFIYFGIKNSNFAFHQEGGNLISFNLHCGGKPKLWYFIPNSEYEKVRALFRYSEFSKYCSQFLKHKSFLLNPAFLKANNIQVYEFIQKFGDIVVTNSWHQGGNLGKVSKELFHKCWF